MKKRRKTAPGFKALDPKNGKTLCVAWPTHYLDINDNNENDIFYASLIIMETQ